MGIETLKVITQKIKAKHGTGVVKGSLYEILIRLYIQGYIRQLVRPFFKPTYPTGHWAFIVGCYNSGTTLLRTIIGFHPEVSTLPREGERFTSVFPDLNAEGWKRMVVPNLYIEESLDIKDADSLGLQAMKDWSPWWPENSVLMEKSITHALRMPFLEKAFHAPKFIATVRNGYCVAEGVRRRAKPSGVAAQELGSSQYPMNLLAEQWVHFNQKIRNDAESVSNIYFMHYEDFIENPVKVLSEIYAFLEVSKINIEFSNDILKVGDREIQLKKTNEASINRLSEEDIIAFNDVAKAELLHHGYQIHGE